MRTGRCPFGPNRMTTGCKEKSRCSVTICCLNRATHLFSHMLSLSFRLKPLEVYQKSLEQMFESLPHFLSTVLVNAQHLSRRMPFIQTLLWYPTSSFKVWSSNQQHQCPLGAHQTCRTTSGPTQTYRIRTCILTEFMRTRQVEIHCSTKHFVPFYFILGRKILKDVTYAKHDSIILSPDFDSNRLIFIAPEKYDAHVGCRSTIWEKDLDLERTHQSDGLSREGTQKCLVFSFCSAHPGNQSQMRTDSPEENQDLPEALSHDSCVSTGCGDNHL